MGHEIVFGYFLVEIEVMGWILDIFQPNLSNLNTKPLDARGTAASKNMKIKSLFRNQLINLK